MMSTITYSDDAKTALEQRDFATALRVAIEAWTTTRSAAIADAIDAISTEASRSFTAPDARTNAEFQTKWLTLLKSNDPVAGGWLADNLFAKLPGSDGDAKRDAFAARLRAVRKVAPDPRIARALMTLVEQGASLVNWSEDNCRKTLAVIGDERTRASLDALAAQSDKDEVRRWTFTKGKLPAIATLSKEEIAAWSLIGPRPTIKATGDREALFNAVLASPDDVQARAVLADCLQEQNDPRGEFISIQLAEEAGSATHDASKRADALLKQHKKTWLGALARVAYRARFRGGFLDELELDGSWKVAKKAWPEIAKDPLLATVTHVHGKPTPDILAYFIGSPALRSLRIVDIFSDQVAEAIEKTLPNTLREVRSTNWKRVDHAKRFRERVLPLIEALPLVNSVALTRETLDLLLASKSAKRITTIAVNFLEDEDVLALWSRLPAHVTTLRWDWSSDGELRREPDGGTLYHVALPEREFVPTDLRELVETHVAKFTSVERVIIECPPNKLPKLGGIDKYLDKFKKNGAKIELRETVFRSGFATGLSA